MPLAARINKSDLQGAPMKNKIIFLCALFLLSLAVLSRPQCVFSQIKVPEEDRLKIKKTDIDHLMEKEGPEILTDTELKYIAGEDKRWFTYDDEIYHYFLIKHDINGKVLKRICKKAGADTVPLTSDDPLQNYQIFEYSEDGKILKEISFDGENKKMYTVVYFYDEKGQKNKTVRYNTKDKEIRSAEFFYDENGLLVKDVEYVKKEIEKYHRFEYDKEDRMIRVMEYHVHENGKGPDGIWFTNDDVVSATKEIFYGPDGTKTKEKKYIGAGPDGIWFTDDDVLQYYVLFEFQKEIED